MFAVGGSLKGGRPTSSFRSGDEHGALVRLASDRGTGEGQRQRGDDARSESFANKEPHYLLYRIRLEGGFGVIIVRGGFVSISAFCAAGLFAPP